MSEYTFLPIGFGCFHFAPYVRARSTLSGTDVRDRIERGLSRLDTVRELDVWFDDEFLQERHVVDVESGGPMRVHPQIGPQWGTVDFELSIPPRVQTELVRSDLLAIHGEVFRVVVSYEYYMPVCFVEILDGTMESEASDAVRVVREFLTASLSGGPDVIFQYLGPAPFHADAFLLPADVGKGAFAVRRELREGYDFLAIEFDRASFATIAEAEAAFHRSAAHELDLFYEVTMSEVERYALVEPVERATEELVAREQAGVFRRAFQLGRLRRLVNDGYLAVAAYESQTARVDEHLARIGRELETLGVRFFPGFLERALADFPTYPMQPYRTLLEVFEGRRLSSLEFAIAGTAAVVGAGLGAVATLLAGS